MNKPLDRAALSVINALANAPVDESFKRGVAMLLHSYDPAQHLEDASRVMSDDDTLSLREDMEEIAKAASAMQKARDELARLSNKWKTDALPLEEIEIASRQVAAELQDAVRATYARRYIP